MSREKSFRMIVRNARAWWRTLPREQRIDLYLQTHKGKEDYRQYRLEQPVRWRGVEFLPLLRRWFQ